MKFKAKCRLLNIKTNKVNEVTVTSIEDIIQVVENGYKDKVAQISIDKYHKVYYSTLGMEKGISCWVDIVSTYDETTGTWKDFKGTDYIVGDNILIVFCNDEYPVDLTDEAYSFITSCLKL